MDEPNNELKSRYQREQIRKESGMDPFEPDEEFATEVAPSIGTFRRSDRRVIRRDEYADQREEEDAEVRQGGMLGWISLALAIASLFILQPILGPAAIITGGIAWAKGSRAFGSWAIILGVIALFAYFILVPYYA